MSLWDRLRKLLGMDRGNERTRPSTRARTNPSPRNAPPATEKSDRAPIRRPKGTISRDESSKGQTINWTQVQDPTDTDMLNTLTLSSDRTTIYLIDDGKAHEFDLTTPEGVLIGLLGNQLSIVSGVEPETPPGGLPDPGGIEDDTDQPSNPPRTVTLPFDSSTSFNIQFNAAFGALSIIGATDMISTRIPNEAERTDISGTCSLTIFSLLNKNIRIRAVRDKLLIWEQDK